MNRIVMYMKILHKIPSPDFRPGIFPGMARSKVENKSSYKRNQKRKTWRRPLGEIFAPINSPDDRVYLFILHEFRISFFFCGAKAFPVTCRHDRKYYIEICHTNGVTRKLDLPFFRRPEEIPVELPNYLDFSGGQRGMDRGCVCVRGRTSRSRPFIANKQMFVLLPVAHPL